MCRAVRRAAFDTGRTVGILADLQGPKLETPEAVADLEAVVAASDGIMVARGDLGVELPLERVPVVQKRAVQLCRENAKPVIVATQMLESACDIGEGLGATALVAFTRSGDTVRRLARPHPRSRLLAFTRTRRSGTSSPSPGGRNRSSSRPRTQPMP